MLELWILSSSLGDVPQQNKLCNPSICYVSWTFVKDILNIYAYLISMYNSFIYFQTESKHTLVQT